MNLPSAALQFPPDVRHIRERSRFGEKEETHRGRQRWGFNLFTFDCEVVLDGVRYGVRPGMASIMPPGTERIFLFTGEESPLRTIHLQMQNDEQTSACIVDLGADFPFALRLFDEAEASFENNPIQATSAIWTLLWTLNKKEALKPEASHLPPALRKALVFLESFIADPISVTDLADAADLSAVHLARLLKQHLGSSPAAYLRTLRLTRAKTLLETTNDPIKAIAAHVGIPDPQHFNKLIRQKYGMSPTQIRKQSGR